MFDRHFHNNGFNNLDQNSIFLLRLLLSNLNCEKNKEIVDKSDLDLPKFE